MVVRMSWLMLGCALGACSGHTSSSGPTAEGGANAIAEPKAGGGASEAGQSSGPVVAGAGAGGASIGTGGEDASVGGSEAPGSEGGASSQGGVSSGGESAMEFPPRGVCGPAFNEYSRRYCPDLSRLSVSLEAIEDAGGDGTVSPGEEGRLVFSLHNPGPEAFVTGPCVGVLGASPGLTVLESYNPSPQLFGVAVGQDATMKMRFRVEPGVIAGTRIPLLAWLDVHGALCPNGDDLRFEILVAP